MPNCSKCGCEMPFNPPNWVRLTEGHFRTYEIEPAILNIGYSESAPYWAFCPDCYKELFMGLTKYTDITAIETKPHKVEWVTSSSADYRDENVLHIDASDWVTGDTICINNLDAGLNNTIITEKN